jgi:hypothetical protein
LDDKMADIKRWGNPESYHAAWVERARIIAGFLDECHTVLDMGSGPQILRPLIKSAYVPVDVVSLCPDTVVIDLDSDWQPEQLPPADGVAMAGLLEHLQDPEAMIAKIATVGRVWAVSYMDGTKHSSHKLISLARLNRAFATAGMRVTNEAKWNRQAIYRLERD